jgi:hypothetical protein
MIIVRGPAVSMLINGLCRLNNSSSSSAATESESRNGADDANRSAGAPG